MSWQYRITALHPEPWSWTERKGNAEDVWEELRVIGLSIPENVEFALYVEFYRLKDKDAA